ncbi:unnamed protein product [Closterium sp. NIES-54]
MAVTSGRDGAALNPMGSANLCSAQLICSRNNSLETNEDGLVAICTDSRTGEHLATFTRRPRSGLYTLTTESTLVGESGQVAASVEVAASCSCRLLTHQTLLWHHRLGHPSLPRLRGMHSCLLVSGLPRSLPPLPRSIAPPCLPCVDGRQCAAPHSSFPPTTAPLQTLHMDDLSVLRLHSERGGEFSSGLLEDFCGVEGIRQTFTLLESPQPNAIAKRRIGLVMEVARTSIVHAAAPHFLWPFAVRYTTEQLKLWPNVSHLETSPTLRWTGEVGDASSSRVWGALLLVRGPPARNLSPRTLRCVFLGFPTDALGWWFYHTGSRRVLSSQDVTFDESVCFYRLHPHRSSPVPLPPLALVSEPPPVSSDTSGPAEGGDPTPATTVTPRRSARLAVPLGFPPRYSSPPLQPVAVDSGAAGGGTTGGAGSSPGGGASRLRAGGAGTARAGGAGTGGAFHARTTRAGGAGTPGAAGGTGGATAVGASVGSPGSRRKESLSPERLHEWAVYWGSPSGGAGRVGAAGYGGAAAGTGGAGAAGGTGGAGPGGASAGVPGVGRAGGTGTGGGADTGGTTGGTIGGTGVSGASWQDPGGGAGGTGYGGAVDTRAGGSGGATTQPQPSVLRHLLNLPPAATEFSVAGTTPPLLFPPTDQSQPQLLPGSSLPAPAPHNEVTASLTARCEPETRASSLERREPETRASVPARVRRPRAPAITMDAKMASWKSKGTYVDEVPSLGAKIVDGMWIFRVKRPSGSPPAFKARYVARGFSHREGVNFFQTFSPTPKMTTLRVLLYVAAQRDYKLHSLNFSTAFLQGSLHEAIWLCLHGQRQAPREWHDTLAALGFAPSTADPSMFLRTDTSLLPFYVLVYVDDLVFATADTEALALVKAELQERHTCTDMGELRSYLGLQITRDRARCTITLTQSHMV